MAFAVLKGVSQALAFGQADGVDLVIG